MRRPSPLLLLLVAALLVSAAGFAADHNDPNSVNSIFSDIPISAADLYDMFGWPADDKSGGEKVVLALTFASIPSAGVFDTDVLYRIHVDPDPRAGRPLGSEDEHTLPALLRYAEAVKDKYVKQGAHEIRVTFDANQTANVSFIGFPAGNFSEKLQTNRVLTVRTPDDHEIKVYIGGRDDAFFNDLPGFFRSINYAPQFYHVPLSWADRRELPIPKTLLELEGNTLFNYDPASPRHGSGVKTNLPPGPYGLTPQRFKKDANGNYRFVYSGGDAQAGININAIVLEIPLAFITRQPDRERIVNAWGESWVLKAANKIETIPDGSGTSFFGRVRAWFRRAFGRGENDHAAELKKYKRVDTDGVPFADAGLSEREDSRQLGSNNLPLARHFVTRFGHLGWGFAPSVTALGLPTCFDHDDATVSQHRHYALATAAFPRVKRCFFQEMNMPDDSWNPKRLDIRLKRPFEIFIPNVNPIDMDTTGSWPFGRRPEDQVATRFLATFLDMRANCIGSKKCDVDTLADQALWNAAPIEPKTPPNPLRNDKPFLTTFPYLADPH
ncbi:MAG TPA: DUF4331 family protein [Thermoanaerobaculia bacterium]|nr:DUF4331 family protein [Thermoanaerobaculia bacterium]